MSKIPVYLMPGLAASAAIFERIKLPEDTFEIVLLEWKIPLDNESLEDYAKRMTVKITQPNPVLIGVSFGGILVQEMAKFIKTRKVIIISSVKSNLEFPRRMKIAKTTKAYKLIPMSLVLNIESLAKFSFGAKVNQRIKLYEKFLSVRDIRYLEWAVEQVILWDRIVADENVIHIHGEADDVFPIKYIKDCTVVKGGTHVMILNKYKWLNENLPRIILE
jgi:pimeloyl-ACP methyl ester carboxylesterase